jgi:hypothetical protein
MMAMGVGYRGFHDALSYCNQACIGAAVTIDEGGATDLPSSTVIGCRP